MSKILNTFSITFNAIVLKIIKSSAFKNYLLVFVLLQNSVLLTQTLRSLAEKNDKFIGNLMRDGFFDDHQIYNGATDFIVKTEYNSIVTGNKLKMSALLKNRPADPFNIQISDIKTDNIDRFIAYANENGMQKRGHVMIWYKQIPNWLEQEAPNWSSQQIYDFTRSYILALSNYTAGKIDEWDVLNEAVVTNGFRTGTWYDRVATQANNEGKIGYLEFFASIFKWARQGDPNVPLVYNDFGAESFGSNKNNIMRKMVVDLKNIYQAPIDVVGLQCHFKTSQMTQNFINSVGKTIDELGDSGFIVNLTELDIRFCDGDGKTLEDQRWAYENLVYTAFSRNNCKTILIWGVSDNDSWIPIHFPGCGEATPHDGNFQKKPAYYGIQDALKGIDSLNIQKLNKNNIIAFPNPSSNILQLKGLTSDYIRIDVFNMIGQKVISKEDVVHNGELELNVSHLKVGAYMLKIIQDEQGHTLRFLKNM